MGPFKRRVTALLGAIVLVSSTVVGPVVAPAGASTTSTCSNAYLHGDARLGPAQLPTSGQVYPIVAGYQPLAGLSAAQFLATYWNPAANGGSGGWNYPPDNGFQLDHNGQPIEYAMGLVAGQEIDRFGSVYGAFLAPLDTPYASRALPPMSLDNFDSAFNCNYHLYRVRKSFRVEAGPIAPGFGQRGLGRQYQLVSSLVPGSPSALNVLWLLNNGYLSAVPGPGSGR